MTDGPETTGHEADRDEEASIVEKVKDKVKEALDAPEAADAPMKTNPVTGQRRDP